MSLETHCSTSDLGQTKKEEDYEEEEVRMIQILYLRYQLHHDPDFVFLRTVVFSLDSDETNDVRNRTPVEGW